MNSQAGQNESPVLNHGYQTVAPLKHSSSVNLDAKELALNHGYQTVAPLKRAAREGI